MKIKLPDPLTCKRCGYSWRPREDLPQVQERAMGPAQTEGGTTMTDKHVSELMEEIAKHDRKVEHFYADPMTDYCPCVSDFQEDFDVQLRKLLGKLLKRAQEIGDKEAEQYALDRLERWMP